MNSRQVKAPLSGKAGFFKAFEPVYNVLEVISNKSYIISSTGGVHKCERVTHISK